MVKPSKPPENWMDGESNGDPANDNNHTHEVPVATAAMGSTALTSLEALGTMLNKVDIVGGGYSGLPMLLFKREGNGTWMYGQARTEPEEDSHWAVDLTSIMRGYICFGDGNKKVGEKLLHISQPMLDITELPDTGYQWNELWTMTLKCTKGTDAGLQVSYRPTTVGGRQAIIALIEQVRNRINGGLHQGKVMPIVVLEKDSYDRLQYGTIYTPVLRVVDWARLGGPVPAPASPPPPASPPSSTAASEQPRRRRVG